MAFNLLVPSSKGLQPARSVKFGPIFDGFSRYKDLRREQGRTGRGGWERGAGRREREREPVGAGAGGRLFSKRSPSTCSFRQIWADI